MKILLAPDKFKGSLSAMQAAKAMEGGIRRFDSNIEVLCHPLSDGGEGTISILRSTLNLKRVEVQVSDPLMRPVPAVYLRGETTAFIEMAQASGLELLSDSERNPLQTTTHGTGELLRHALESGAKEIYLFIGGSATNDAGIGMAAALGYQFLSSQGMIDQWNGEVLRKIIKVDDSQIDPLLAQAKFTVLCDVDNALYGPQGAAHVFARQKGASDRTVEKLDEGLRDFAKILNNKLEYVAGAGAAGGLGYGAMTFLNARLESGIEFMLERTGFDNQLKGADLVITGEGRVDAQSLGGKVISGIQVSAQSANIPIAIIAGEVLDSDIINETWNPIDLVSLKDSGVSKEESMKRAAELLEESTFRMMGRVAKHFSGK